MSPPQASVLTRPERRAMRRFPMKLPAMVRVCGVPYDFPVQTENISARGMFFHIDRWMNEGAHIVVTMNFSSKVTMTSPLQVRFLARVLRVDRQKRVERAGVAAIIEQYECQPLSEEPKTSADVESSFQFAL
jgi:predicted ATP-dependent protease